MNELIDTQNNRAIIRSRLLATVSALAMTIYVTSASHANAEDTDRRPVWIELGGQMELLQGTSSAFDAPFMSISPTPGPYSEDIFAHGQRSPRLALGLEGKFTFEPSDSDWVLSAAIRYGRSETRRHVHHQSPEATGTIRGNVFNKYAAAFADAKSAYKESQTVLDFSAGKEVGLGSFGGEGTSTVSAGVRFAQFSTKSTVSATGRPSINVVPVAFGNVFTFYNYTMVAHSARSFRGVGPSLSWNASATVSGSKQAGELTLDWGLSGAVLFGRQKAKTDHTTQAYYLPFTPYVAYEGYHYTRVYQHLHHSTRSRSVTIPNLGGFASVSVKYPNMKFSLGYRADFFFGAVDAGIDQLRTKDLGFQGPFAAISIALGG